jgi:cell filamentation protein
LTGYDRFDDPYCYLGTGVLRNLKDLRSADALEAFEVASFILRTRDKLPTGKFDPAHYRAIHHHLFQDVYDWAGQYRTIRIAKGSSMFCFPEHIAGQMELLFPALQETPFQPGAAAEHFISAAASFLAELNALHPFREGNGRTQLTFLFLLGTRAGIALDMTRIKPQAMLAAMIASFAGELTALQGEIAVLLV